MNGKGRHIKKARVSPGLVADYDCSNLPAIPTTAAATAATEPAAAAARTTAATGAGLVLSFVDTQLATTHIVTVQALDGTGSIGLAHLNKPETAWATGLTIGRQRNGLDRTVL